MPKAKRKPNKSEPTSVLLHGSLARLGYLELAHQLTEQEMRQAHECLQKIISARPRDYSGKPKYA